MYQSFFETPKAIEHLKELFTLPTQALEDGTLEDIEDDMKPMPPPASGKKKKRRRDDDDEDIGPNGKPAKVSFLISSSGGKYVKGSVGSGLFL